jgi:CDP-glucose 4,6-dehydratase
MDKIEKNNNQILLNFKGKKVFITGHTGFKGTWLTYLLTQLGAEVMGYSLEPYPGPSHFNMLELNKKIQHVVGDIRDANLLNEKLNSFQPEIVFHLAAQPLVKKSYADPVTTYSTNIMGSVNLLEAVRYCKSIKSLVYITSDKCYENSEWIWGYRENDRMGGHDPYSASKGAAELVFSSYERSFFKDRTNFGAVTVRAGNVIGGGDWAEDRIIPDCIRAIENGVPIQIRNPLATRPWQHVLEPISGYILLAIKLLEDPIKYSGAWNFGPSSFEVRTVLDVASTIIHNLQKGSVEITGSENEHHEAMLLQLNCDKAHQILKWSPRWGVEETLLATTDWFKHVLAGKPVEEITKAQLNNFFNNLI